jgi:hypothetical protein
MYLKMKEETKSIRHLVDEREEGILREMNKHVFEKISCETTSVKNWSMLIIKEKITNCQRDAMKDYDSKIKKINDSMNVEGLIGPNESCLDFDDYVKKEHLFRVKTAEHFTAHANRMEKLSDELARVDVTKIESDKRMQDLRDFSKKVG